MFLPTGALLDKGAVFDFTPEMEDFVHEPVPDLASPPRSQLLQPGHHHKRIHPTVYFRRATSDNGKHPRTRSSPRGLGHPSPAPFHVQRFRLHTLEHHIGSANGNDDFVSNFPLAATYSERTGQYRLTHPSLARICLIQASGLNTVTSPI